MKNLEKQRKIALIGGDLRSLAAAEALREQFKVSLYGFGHGVLEYDGVVDRKFCSDGLIENRELNAYLNRFGDELCSDLDSALEQSSAVVLPLPASQDGIYVSTPFSGERIKITDLIELMKSKKIKLLCGGKLGRELCRECTLNEIELFDYYARDEFAIANAVPTAEGAIAIAMDELPITLHGATALVIGNGRIGKVLSEKLSALKMKVTVSARKAEDFALIGAMGCESAKTGELLRLLEDRTFNVIFNTVPHTLLTEEVLRKIPRETLIIDLASKPGGVDVDAAGELGIRVIWALSLPGKCAPISAGRIIAETISGFIGYE